MDNWLVWTCIALAISAIFYINGELRKKRRQELMKKYGDEAIVDKIMNRLIWQGMTAEQLIDSWGRPVETDQKVFKTKTRETYKYTSTGRNRFANRVFVEDRIVVGWQQAGR